MSGEWPYHWQRHIRGEQGQLEANDATALQQSWAIGGHRQPSVVGQLGAIGSTPSKRGWAIRGLSAAPVEWPTCTNGIFRLVANPVTSEAPHLRGAGPTRSHWLATLGWLWAIRGSSAAPGGWPSRCYRYHCCETILGHQEAIGGEWRMAKPIPSAEPHSRGAGPTQSQ